MQHTVEEIMQFLKDFACCDEIYPHSDICNDLGLDGDDFHDMIELYTKQFSVNMSDYLWYFHCKEEGNNLGSLIFPAPNKLVSKISVSPVMLTNFANNGKWGINYPKHKIPKRRYDIIINRLLIVFLLLATLVLVVSEWF